MATLVGINAKFHRAHEQLSSLNSDINLVGETQRHFIAKEIEPETGQKIWVFRGETPDIPIEWSVRIGEILYNFRSALDHLIEQLILANERVPTNRNAFPVFLCPNKFQSDSKPMLTGVSSRVEAIIEGLQPYHGHDIMKHLWRLHCLHNTDKHRHLNMVTVPTIGGGTIIGSADPRFAPLARQGNFTPHTGPLGKNTVVLRSRDPEMEVDVRFTIEITFSDSIPQVTDNLPVIKILDVICYSVHHAIESLKPELT
jgi:hypothetical protein